MDTEHHCTTGTRPGITRPNVLRPNCEAGETGDSICCSRKPFGRAKRPSICITDSDEAFFPSRLSPLSPLAPSVSFSILFLLISFHFSPSTPN